MVDRQRTLRWLLDAYNQGLITRLEVSHKALEVLANADVDGQLAELSSDELDWVVWDLRDSYAPIIGRDPAAFEILEGVTVQPGAEEEYRQGLARRVERLRTIEVPSIQHWLRAHPLPACNPFPTALVRGLLARVEHDRKAVWSRLPLDLTRREQKTWLKRERYDELCEVGTGLLIALERAELAGAGSQEQALAWNGFFRVAHLLLLRQDLSIEEGEFMIDAQQRRHEHLSALRQ